jgi:Tol biopolymer transport system component
VYVADLAGGDAQPVADAPSAIPRWSPDGRHIAYALDRGIDSTVRVVEADGSGARTIASPGGWPFWFPDGNRIGYLAIGTDGNEEVRIVRLDAPGPPEPLAGLRLSGRNQPCDVSRDGRFLATTDSVDVTSEIWILE